MLEQYGISFPYANINLNTTVWFFLNGGKDDALVCGQSGPPGGPLCVQGATLRIPRIFGMHDASIISIL